MRFTWVDYRTEDAAIVDQWLDEAAVRMTGIEDGWDNYWNAVLSDAVNFPGCRDCCKIIWMDGMAAAAIVFGCFQGMGVVAEIVVAPKHRGSGLGSQVLRELVAHSDAFLGEDIRKFTAVVFSDNLASQRAFLKAGFVLDSVDEKAKVHNYLWES